MIFYAVSHQVGEMTEWNLHRSNCTAIVDKSKAKGFNVPDRVPQDKALKLIHKRLGAPKTYTVYMGCLTYMDVNCDTPHGARTPSPSRKINPRAGNVPVTRAVEAPEASAGRRSSGTRVDHSQCTHGHSSRERRACRAARGL